MALKKSSTYRAAPQHQRGHVPPLPHPSWRLNREGPQFAAGVAPIKQARDFWDRLGI
jgi:hypothetical protein